MKNLKSLALLPSRNQFRNWSLPAKWSVIGGIAGLIGLGITFASCLLTKATPAQSAPQARQILADPSTGKTALYPRTKRLVDSQTEYLIREKIDPWLFMQSKQITIALHDGKEYSCYGLEFSGSVKMFFWSGFMDPFLKDSISRIFNNVSEECRVSNIDPSVPLDEAASLLRGMACQIYDRMAYVDQKLRSKNLGDKPPRKNTQEQFEAMNIFISEQLIATKAIYSTNN